jgi:hypothetical protein
MEEEREAGTRAHARGSSIAERMGRLGRAQGEAGKERVTGGEDEAGRARWGAMELDLEGC